MDRKLLLWNNKRCWKDLLVKCGGQRRVRVTPSLVWGRGTHSSPHLVHLISACKIHNIYKWYIQDIVTFYCAKKKRDKIIFIPYLVNSCFAAVGAPGGFAEPDPDPGPEQGTDSHMGGPRLHRPSAWSWGQYVWWHCWWLWHFAGQVQLYWWHSAGRHQVNSTWLKRTRCETNKWSGKMT